MPAAGQAAAADATRARVQAEYRQAEARDNLARKAEAEGMVRSAARMDLASPAPAPAPRVAAKRVSPRAAAMFEGVAPVPVWSLETLPDGATRVMVAAPREDHLFLLRRGAAGAEVLVPRIREAGPGALAQWRFQVHLAPGDALDLYRMNGPVADPAALPAQGPVDGYRARIHPAGK
jgi:hypothetical protein